MALQIRDANGIVQIEPTYVDPVYRAAGVVLATNTAAGKDFLLFTAPASGVTRLLKAKFAVQGVAAASASITVLSMNRVVAAPTGGAFASVVLTQHDTAASAPGSTVKTVAQSGQTAGTSATVLSEAYVGVAAADLTVSQYELPCGPESIQQAIIVPQSGFVTFRLSAALPTAAAISFDIMFSESAL